jgi:VWFA-related protein
VTRAGGALSRAPEAWHVVPSAVLLSLVLAAAIPLAERADPSQQRIVGTPATGVLVDVVVRDRHGALVTDLDAKDVEILEDGVRQSIVSFEPPRVGTSPVTGADHGRATARPASPISSGAPHLVALVFHELGPEARAAAEKAARVYLSEQKGSDEFAGVFAIDRALHTLVPYTRDAGALERGVRNAAMRPGCPLVFAGDVPSAESGIGSGWCSTPKQDRVQIVEILQALTDLVDSLQLVPGRKSVLFFSEGLQLQSESDVLVRFNALVGRANRSGVSFYTVDAAGLRVHAPSAEPRKVMREFHAETPGVTVSPDQVMFVEPYVALSRLAAETGGAFLDNTNELERAPRRMVEDLRSYYMLGYTPTNSTLDGKYRHLEVRVRRPDVSVQARAGYLALPLRQTLAPYDVAPLLILEQGTQRQDFHFDAAVDTKRRRTVVSAHVDHRMLRYVDNTESVTCQAHLTVLARAVDKDGRTLWIGSDAFDLSTSIPHCGTGEQGTTSFEREVALPPTTARVDVIAYDALAERASVREFQIRGGKR